ALVREGRVGGRELGIAVGRQVDTGEGLVVQAERERQRDRDHGIIAMIARVRRAWHDTAANLRYGVLASSSAWHVRKRLRPAKNPVGRLHRRYFFCHSAIG